MLRTTGSERPAFSLIEAVVVIAVIGILLALLLPAIQFARESARRVQCAHNLMQLGLAIQQYHDAFSSLPPGRIKLYDPRYAGPDPPCTALDADKSLAIFVLPFMEQNAIFNAINQNLAIVGAENSTCHSVVISGLACPSDPMSGVARNLEPGALAQFGVPDPALMVFTSYAGSMGSLRVAALPLISNNCAPSWTLFSQSNGAFNDVSPLRLSSMTDGLSNTIFAAEKSTTILQQLRVIDPAIVAKRGWYITGNWGDTLVTALYPPNAYKKTILGATGAWTDAASSLHPGGVHVLMGDGSVRFVLETIQSWPTDARTGNPVGSSLNSNGFWVNVPSEGVWQALSTRSGGEVIDVGSL